MVADPETHEVKDLNCFTILYLFIQQNEQSAIPTFFKSHFCLSCLVVTLCGETRDVRQQFDQLWGLYLHANNI